MTSLPPSSLPLLVIGVGRLGGAIVGGLLAAQALDPADLLLVDPAAGDVASDAGERGAALNPGEADYARARTVLLAIKPQDWRGKAAAVAPHLAPGAAVLSVLAGVRLGDLAEAFPGHPVARVMPTTAVAVGKGAASLFSEQAEGVAAARTLFAPIATVVEMPEEACLDAATAVSGSAPAYLYAFVEALEAAGQSVGLSADTSAALARSTIVGAAALMEQSPLPPAELRAQGTSPGGTTQAALDVLRPAFGPLLRDAVRAAAARSKELAAS